MGKDLIISKDIKNKIYTIRATQVMLDNDLANLYCVETKVLNQAVKRNIDRFPKEFMFQLKENEYNILRSQIVTLEKGRGKHKKYMPYVFTEQGVAMLSSVLRSDIAIKVSIAIIKAFVSMRRFIFNNAGIFQRLDNVEIKQINTNKDIKKIYDIIDSKKITPKQGIFYNGQIFDAYKFIIDIIKTSKKSIILIDNYIDESILTLLSKKNKNVNITIYTDNINSKLKLDIEKFNKQYKSLNIIKFTKSHDRFLIIDNKDIYHFGASLKDLGKKWFAFSKFDKKYLEILSKLKEKEEKSA